MKEVSSAQIFTNCCVMGFVFQFVAYPVMTRTLGIDETVVTITLWVFYLGVVKAAYNGELFDWSPMFEAVKSSYSGIPAMNTIFGRAKAAPSTEEKTERLFKRSKKELEILERLQKDLQALKENSSK